VENARDYHRFLASGYPVVNMAWFGGRFHGWRGVQNTQKEKQRTEKKVGDSGVSQIAIKNGKGQNGACRLIEKNGFAAGQPRPGDAGSKKDCGYNQQVDGESRATVTGR
jgi:hypothetical protein